MMTPVSCQPVKRKHENPPSRVWLVRGWGLCERMEQWKDWNWVTEWVARPPIVKKCHQLFGIDPVIVEEDWCTGCKKTTQKMCGQWGKYNIQNHETLLEHVPECSLRGLPRTIWKGHFVMFLMHRDALKRQGHFFLSKYGQVSILMGCPSLGQSWHKSKSGVCCSLSKVWHCAMFHGWVPIFISGLCAVFGIFPYNNVSHGTEPFQRALILLYVISMLCRLFWFGLAQ